MAGRIEEGYREKFRALLALVRPRRLSFGVDLLIERARRKSEREGTAPDRALLDVYLFTLRRVRRRVAVTSRLSMLEARRAFARGDESCIKAEAGKAGPAVRFVCDASLGGLARWLRAAGYQAIAASGSKGTSLAREATGEGNVLLTSDSRLMSERPIREGTVFALWVPSTLRRTEQLALVLADLGLTPQKPPRCMACGGELRAVEKEAVRERIPPRTALWKDEYFVCAGCNGLFWEGTHWERIQKRLSVALVPF